MARVESSSKSHLTPEVILASLHALERGEPAVLSGEFPGIYSEIAKTINALSQKQIGHPNGATNGATEHHLNGSGEQILAALIACKKGDCQIRLPYSWSGIPGKIADAFNDVMDLNSRMQTELVRLKRVVGKEGKLKQRASLGDVDGFWRTNTEAINSLIEDLVHPSSEVARVIGAVAQGDLSKSMALEVDDRPLEGEFLRTAKTINKMVLQLGTFAAEVTRVAREVGTEGKLGGQAKVQGVAGTWKDLTDSVNSMAGNLTGQVRNIAEVTTAVARGDLSKKITVDVKGELLALKITINTMVDQLNSFAAEVTRVAREVGTEGRLGGQADVQGVSGTWKDLTESVNLMAGNLTAQVRNIAEVTKAVAKGDLSKKIAVDVKGEILDLKNTINTMVDQLRSFAAEVTRVAREVGSEGMLGGQADVQGVSGTWKDLTESVNLMAGNITAQVRNIAKVTTAVAMGDLSKKITVEVKGEISELKNTINTMVDQLSSFAAEVTRVAREVGTEGKLGGQATVPGVAGTWKLLTDSVNSMAGNLTGQVRNIAEVTTAVAMGDLTKKITVDVKGEILKLKNTINTMVDQLSSFAAEVTRVAREVGSEGKLGGQADVPGVAGTWKDLTDSVNSMAGNLTDQVRNIADVTTAVATGDLTKKITVDVKGEILKLKNTINTMVDTLRSFAAEVTRVAREVGTEGRLGGQADVQGVAGTWKDLTESVNFMAGNLTAQVRNIADVTKAVAAGDLSKKIEVDVKGEILDLKNTINVMVDQLRSFAAEVTRVAREVGTDGKLGGQGNVPGVAGTWKDLTDSVNSMAGNLTAQVRGIAKVVTAVANGDLQQKLTVEAKGEIAALADTMNSMTDTLATFAEQVTSVAREVGVEGKLGGQAKVPGASGTWKNLTENVNQLAANLTAQVRAIADVATAVTQGNLTRSIAVDAQGEVAILKDTINEMIRNLHDTTLKNTEQDWLKTNLAKFSRLLQGQKDLVAVGQTILSELAPVVGAQQAEFYIVDSTSGNPTLRLLASYASGGQHSHGKMFALGEGLIGQCALDCRKILLEGGQGAEPRIVSGLSSTTPHNILVLPIVFEGMARGVVELASLERLNPTHQQFLDQLTESIGIVINTIEANMRTETLLIQSQSLATELQSRQQELQTTNKELQEKAQLLVQQNEEVESKNAEVEQARQALEEKAKQLARTSRYKSEFLANMSHELRTPLNSLLILSDQLCQNKEGNLSEKQVEFSKTIHSSGNDLLTLINDILDLSKIESGTVVVDFGELRFDDLHHYCERTFRHIAEAKNLEFLISLDPRLPVSMVTDSKRLQQILKNLLSNAFKFTHSGQITLSIEPVKGGWRTEFGDVSGTPEAVAFRVTDTGIGISSDKQQIVFEAFQQADGSTSRKYGGTGLGLAISRELSRLLGGEINLTSSVGQGSEFTLYLPTGLSARVSRRTHSYTEAEEVTTREIRTASIVGPLLTDSDDVLMSHTEGPPPVFNEAGDDRDNIESGDRVVLIVENDLAFAKVLLECVRENQSKGIVTAHGASALALTRDFTPDLITLDLKLADMDGWRVLARLKNDLTTRHIPVCVVSTDESRERAYQAGAIGFIGKPIASKTQLEKVLERLFADIDRATKRMIIATNDDDQRQLFVKQFASDDVQVETPASKEEILKCLSSGRVDCLVLNEMEVPAADLARAIEEWPSEQSLPVIIFSGQASTEGVTAYDGRITLRNVQSNERLLDAVMFCLHKRIVQLSEGQHRLLEDLHQTDAALVEKRALVVDDDIRNIFALATILEDHGISVASASNGREALRQMASEKFDIVLMDIMMPEMDGIATMREARKIESCRDLPIIAVTAKAMKGDRERCIDAGAWDYLSKPVDPSQLLAVLRSWLHR
jgi:HAMP domain-containing protein/signal transduction histidine kinase/DNA-binding response OmpR family regulator